MQREQPKRMQMETLEGVLAHICGVKEGFPVEMSLRLGEGMCWREDPKRWKKEYSRTEVENGETSDMPGEGGNFQVVQGLSVIPMSWRFVLYKLLEVSGQENDLMKPPFREMNLVGLSQE